MAHRQKEKEAVRLICVRKVVRSKNFWKAMVRIVAGVVLVGFVPVMPLKLLGPVVAGWGIVSFFHTHLPSCPSGPPCCVA